MTTLYLHIGHPKCGSSTIQKYLQVNAGALMAQGVGVIDKRLKIAASNGKDTSLVRYFRQVHLDPGLTEQTKGNLSRAIKKVAATTPKLVISAENLSNPNMVALFEDLAQHMTVKVIYYIRRQDDWVLSAWKQWYVKQGTTLEQAVQHHVREQTAFYRDPAEAWLNLVGKDNFYIQVMDKRALHNGDLIADFCHHVGIDTAPLQAVANENQSFDYDLLEVLARLPFLFDNPHDNELYGLLERDFGDFVHAQKGAKNPMTREIREQILAAHQEENMWLRETFFRDTDFDKCFLSVPDHPAHRFNQIDGLTRLLGINLKMSLNIRQDLQDIKKRLGLPTVD